MMGQLEICSKTPSLVLTNASWGGFCHILMPKKEGELSIYLYLSYTLQLVQCSLLGQDQATEHMSTSCSSSSCLLALKKSQGSIWMQIPLVSWSELKDKPGKTTCQ